VISDKLNFTRLLWEKRLPGHHLVN